MMLVALFLLRSRKLKSNKRGIAQVRGGNSHVEFES
jgi:hypothetical protein